jgi:phage repressor protein C with HTH and peptisase S24 domain
MSGRELLLQVMETYGWDWDALADRTGFKERTLRGVARDEIRMSDPMRAHLQFLLEVAKNGATPLQNMGAGLREEPGDYAKNCQRIPVISWASAGRAAQYEELPRDWQKFIVTSDVPDKDAFAVEIEGDSMEPKFQPGDCAIAMPTMEPRNGCLVIAKLRDDGVVFKIYQAAGGVVHLSSYNPIYPTLKYSPEEFHWIFPVFAVNKKTWI